MMSFTMIWMSLIKDRNPVSSASVSHSGNSGEFCCGDSYNLSADFLIKYERPAPNQIVL